MAAFAGVLLPTLVRTAYKKRPAADCAIDFRFTRQPLRPTLHAPAGFSLGCSIHYHLSMSIALVTGSETCKKFHSSFDFARIENDVRARFFGPEASTTTTRQRIETAILSAPTESREASFITTG